MSRRDYEIFFERAFALSPTVEPINRRGFLRLFINSAATLLTRPRKWLTTSE